VVSPVQCTNLKKYVESMTNHWFGIIHEKYALLLQAALDAFGWPFLDALDNAVSVLHFVDLQYEISLETT